jgi:hypothetical protein
MKVFKKRLRLRPRNSLRLFAPKGALLMFGKHLFFERGKAQNVISAQPRLVFG